MIGKKNRPESEISRRIEAVRTSGEKSFRNLLLAGGFDLNADLRFQNLSGLSFIGEDLRGIDFTGANVVGCHFDGALIEGSHFDGARLGMIGAPATDFADLSRTEDWALYKKNWEKAPDVHAQMSEDVLPTWSITMDSPLTPLMVVLPPVTFDASRTSPQRIAVSMDYLTGVEHANYFIDTMPEYDDQPLAQIPYVGMNWSHTQDYIEWVKTISGRSYRAPYVDELKLLVLLHERILASRTRSQAKSSIEPAPQFRAWHCHRDRPKEGVQLSCVYPWLNDLDNFDSACIRLARELNG